ncbi:MAG: helix-turn-helix transcriptional regulator [Chloroflexota bacterium]
MDDQRIGRVIRALRRRRGWRQIDLARAAGCSQRTVSRAEAGHLPALRVLRQILAALDASLVVDIRWRAGALDRLLDEDHSAVVGALAELLGRLGWEVRVEVTYSVFGERGSYDIMAWDPTTLTLLVIEVKTDLASAEATLRKLDEKTRLAPKIARETFGWNARSTVRLLVMPDLSTLRRRIDRRASVFDRALPDRGHAVRRWLRAPSGPIAGLWFLLSYAMAIRGRRAGWLGAELG